MPLFTHLQSTDFPQRDQSHTLEKREPVQQMMLTKLGYPYAEEKNL
jgi:hypothetical protein